MEFLPTLDAHAHIAPEHSSKDLEDSGAVLAMTLSLDEAAQVLARQEAYITWGVGCHPRAPTSQRTFDLKRFGELAERTAIIGEIGLDSGSRVPLELQLTNFRQAIGSRFQTSPFSQHSQLSCDRARAARVRAKTDFRANFTLVDG